MTNSDPSERAQEAKCCFCGLTTVDGRDGVRLDISRGGPPTQMVVWAHLACLVAAVTREFVDYLDMAFPGDDEDDG